ncbi:hypothetical protein [Terrabacter sp. 2YAF2]|uniref:hypothetical protein n=1 Tax=Terrabacter sp. 2YAF2 TaxID=3233026 RepID=UPI003F9436DA
MRVAFVVAVAAAAWVANRVFDSGWVALAVGCLVLTTPWTLYLLITHRQPQGGQAKQAAATTPRETSDDSDVAAAGREAYRKVRQDLFPLASRPELLSKPLAGAREAWERSHPTPPTKDAREEDGPTAPPQ